MDDPRYGLRTEEVTQLDRAEPDPALFRIPAGYTIREQEVTLPEPLSPPKEKSPATAGPLPN